MSDDRLSSTPGSGSRKSPAARPGNILRNARRIDRRLTIRPHRTLPRILTGLPLDELLEQPEDFGRDFLSVSCASRLAAESSHPWPVFRIAQLSILDLAATTPW